MENPDSPLLATSDTGSSVLSLAVSSNGKFIATGSTDCHVRIWDADTRTVIAEPLQGHSAWVRSVAFSPDSARVVSGSEDRTIRIWDVQNRSAVGGPLVGHTDFVYSVAVSRDGTRIVSASRDATLYVWDAHNGLALAGPLKGHTSGINSVAFSPDSKRIVSGSYDCTLRIWDVQTGTTIGEPLRGHTESINSVSFSPDGRQIVSGSDDHTLRLWDAHSGDLVSGPLIGHIRDVRSVAFSPDSACIASCSWDLTIRIWDSRTGFQMGEPLEGHTNWINAVVFSHDGAHIFSSSSDRTICVWDVEKGSREGQRVVLADQRKISHGSQSVVVSSEMSATDMFDCLLEHGCIDFTSRMDPMRYSSIATAGGSFGDVWKGRLLNGRQVAIKCLRFHTIAEDRPKGLKRAVREIYMWSKAKHPNVQELMGIIMFQERLGMVSLWMDNGNLQEYVRKNPDVDRYELCIQIASGVSYLHSIDMVHGDIKALNILVSRDGVAKLSDFDHSILSNCTLAFSATTNVGGGTLRWMAPELLLRSDDENETDPPASSTKQTDIYALGMTMLETITGKVPYAEYRKDMGIYGALTNKQPPARPSELLGPDVQPDQMWHLLLRCWDHNPTARPNALSVLTSLQKIVFGDGLDLPLESKEVDQGLCRHM